MNKKIMRLPAAALIPLLLLLSCGKKETEWVTYSGEVIAVDLAGTGKDSVDGRPAAGGPAPVEVDPVTP